MKATNPAALAAMLLCAASGAFAQPASSLDKGSGGSVPALSTSKGQAYPVKSIRVIAGFPPGSGADITARVIGARLNEALGQQIVVDNRLGAASNIAAELAVKSPPDGYTLFIGTVANTINATLYKKPPFDIARDFAPMFSPSSTVLPHVKTGRLRALAVTTVSRLPTLAELPTVAESGLKGYETITWFGFVAPAKTPQAAVTRLNAEIVKVLALPEVRSQFAAQGIETLGGTPERFAAYIRDEIKKWAKVIRLSGAKAE